MATRERERERERVYIYAHAPVINVFLTVLNILATINYTQQNMHINVKSR